MYYAAYHPPSPPIPSFHHHPPPPSQPMGMMSPSARHPQPRTSPPLRRYPGDSGSGSVYIPDHQSISMMPHAPTHNYEYTSHHTSLQGGRKHLPLPFPIDTSVSAGGWGGDQWASN